VEVIAVELHWRNAGHWIHVFVIAMVSMLMKAIPDNTSACLL